MNKNLKNKIEILKQMNACLEAIQYLETQDSWVKAWDNCPRADWQLWVAGAVKYKREDLVLAACACARTSLKYVPKGENRPRHAIEVAEAWARGKATIEQVKIAAYADAASYAYAAAASAAASYAAASYAAYASDASYAYYASYAAADAADADADTKTKALKHMTTLVKKHIDGARVGRALMRRSR